MGFGTWRVPFWDEVALIQGAWDRGKGGATQQQLWQKRYNSSIPVNRVTHKRRLHSARHKPQCKQIGYPKRYNRRERFHQKDEVFLTIVGFDHPCTPLRGDGDPRRQGVWPFERPAGDESIADHTPEPHHAGCRPERAAVGR